MTKSATNGRKKLTSLSLFTGAGGLDLGLERAGFSVQLCVELDEASRATLRSNQSAWRLAEPGDIHLLTPGEILDQAGVKRGELTLLAGGPPCQPFSKSSYWVSGDTLRLRDPRAQTLRAYLRLVEHALPEIIMLENVKGLAFDNKDEGLTLLKRGLDRINREYGVRYVPHVVHLNSVDYGVPQLRERVFVIAHRDGKAFTKPSPTHGPVEKLVDALQPYRTAWEAIGDLDGDRWPDELNVTGKWAKLLPSIPEGGNYLWHTARGGGMPLFGWRTRFWSFLLKLAKNQPSWTIQAQPGPATGPFHWRSRRLSIRELCRLQTFPDGHKIVGSYREAHVQVGNAVPPVIGELLGLAIRRQFFGEDVAERPRLPSIHAGECPDPEKPQAVPVAYRSLKGKYRDHPGPGLGPGARKRAKVKRPKEQSTHTRVRQPAA